MELYNRNALVCSIVTTKNYSTSFSLAVRLLDKKIQLPIYALYGFVRYADEIVDTLHTFDKHALLKKFKEDTYSAIEMKVSINPILHSFQQIVHQYKIEQTHIEAFFFSMEMDLYDQQYDKLNYEKYIYGSAEVVGLMCLRIFYPYDDIAYNNLKLPAQKLGQAFQKINFLRDLENDYTHLGRTYFPNIDFNNFKKSDKEQIENEISSDFQQALLGIKELTSEFQLGVYLAYSYYWNLFKKIKKAHPKQIIKQRFRINNPLKIVILITCYFKYKLGLVN